MRSVFVVSYLLVLTVSASAGTLSGAVIDDGVSAELVDIIQLPASDGAPPLARIEFLREVPDGSGRLFANDMRGPLHLIQGTSVSTYMDLDLLVGTLLTGNLQMGFVSFAFHPDFASNGLLYTAHTEQPDTTAPNLEPPVSVTTVHHAVITEWQATDPAADLFSGSSRELMRIASPHPFHNLGEIGFDPNLTAGDTDYGLLYIAAGDFGSVVRGDLDQLQRLDTVYGCLLRIDPLGGPFLRNTISYPYGIPGTNPYANDGNDNTFGEIFAHGFRNPQNFHFDRGGTGTLFLAEIGESNLEEVNLPHAGANYGWPEREGTYAIDTAVDRSTVFPLPGNDASFGYTYPVSQFDHEEGFAIAGGLAVRVSPPSPLLGKFVFGDIVSGRMFYSDIDEMIAADDGDPSTTATVYELHLLRDGTETILLDVVRAALGNPTIARTDLRFSSDLQGRLYVTTKQDGFIRELVPVPTGPTGTSPAPTSAHGVTNVPNPFNPRTEIVFSLPQPAQVRLTIYDMTGRRIRVLLDRSLDPGDHRYPWDGRDQLGTEVASGVYVYRLEIDGRQQTGKMSLIR